MRNDKLIMTFCTVVMLTTSSASAQDQFSLNCDFMSVLKDKGTAENERPINHKITIDMARKLWMFHKYSNVFNIDAIYDDRIVLTFLQSEGLTHDHIVNRETADYTFRTYDENRSEGGRGKCFPMELVPIPSQTKRLF